MYHIWLTIPTLGVFSRWQDVKLATLTTTFGLQWVTSMAFKLYNRYMIKNSDGSDKVMTFYGTVSDGKNLAVAEPNTTVDEKTYTSGNEIFELLSGDVIWLFPRASCGQQFRTISIMSRETPPIAILLNSVRLLPTGHSDWICL